jgi:hypothetical protein
MFAGVAKTPVVTCNPELLYAKFEKNKFPIAQPPESSVIGVFGLQTDTESASAGTAAKQHTTTQANRTASLFTMDLHRLAMRRMEEPTFSVGMGQYSE